jgi:hypothetical protein
MGTLLSRQACGFSAISSIRGGRGIANIIKSRHGPCPGFTVCTVAPLARSAFLITAATIVIIIEHRNATFGVVTTEPVVGLTFLKRALSLVTFGANRIGRVRAFVPYLSTVLGIRHQVGSVTLSEVANLSLSTFDAAFSTVTRTIKGYAFS